ncbi:MAG TPA: DUF420 domain-containing protein, partial [Bacilli bacterium]
TAWKVPYVIFLLFHIVLSTSAAIFGVITLFLAFSQRFAAHRKWGRVTAAFWLATAVTGVVVYLLLYIVFPGGHTGSLPNAVINR